MSGHFDAFHELEPQKKERIINAALDEIASKGFKKASTNAIVEKAGISKGTLFYYFSSKEELFDFLCGYTIEFARQEYAAKFEHEAKTRDFIERYRVLTEIKRYSLRTYPKIIKFYESFYLPENTEYFSKYRDAIKNIREHVFASLYDNIDYSLFRDDIEPEKIVTYIKWLLDRYEKDLMAKMQESALDSGFSESTDIIMGKEIEEEFSKFYAFLADLRKAFYK